MSDQRYYSMMYVLFAILALQAENMNFPFGACIAWIAAILFALLSIFAYFLKGKL